MAAINAVIKLIESQTTLDLAALAGAANVSSAIPVMLIKFWSASSQKRLSDQMIANLLNKKGYGLARRTINKYRQKSIRLEVSSSKIKTLYERN